jgi:hypothetical protein
MTLRPISVAALLVLMPAAVMAADASPQSPSSPPPQAGEEGALPTPLAAQPFDRLSATREHPLFSPTRRPPPPPPQVVAAPEPPPPPAPPPNVALFGIVMDGEEAHAVVQAGPAEKIRRVGIGDDIGGWKVAQIEGRRLVLALDGRIATIMMFSGNTSANAAARTGEQAPPTGRHSQAQTQPQNQAGQDPPAPNDAQVPAARRQRRPR